jgi:glycosyltransferase involved in cell wall biosynthesis
MSHFSHTYGPVADRPQRRFPCAVTPSAFSDPAVRPRVRAALGLEDRQVLVYVGSLAPYQMAPEMIQLFGALHARTPQAFLLIVSQAAAQRWHALAREHGLPGDSYRVVTGRNEDVAQLTAAGDVGLMLRDESLVNAVAFPTKLGEYLAAGVPVLTSAATRDPAQLIAAQRVGFVAPHVSDLTAATVGEFLRHVCTNRHEWAERCQFTATRELAWPSYAAALTDDYEQLARRNAS